MIKVDKTQCQNDPAWLAVRAEAATATAKLVSDFEASGDVTINDRLYKKFMPFLNNLFNGKCAYCETVIASNQPGDVEHFRPKGRLLDFNFKPVRCGNKDHPGYWWLAYDWGNLLPACIDCNRYRRHASTADDGSPSGAGKADRFPVKDHRACKPGEEQHEEAMLINPGDPRELDPAEHLDFQANGTIRARTDKGTATLELLGLNLRERLVEERSEAFGTARQAYKVYIQAVLADSIDSAAQALGRIDRMRRGRSAYAALQRMALKAEEAALARGMSAVRE